MRITFLTLILGLTGCSSIQKMAIKSVTPIFVAGSHQLGEEKNWDFFRDAMPANLKLYEILYLQDRNNLELLGSIIKGYTGYAFGIAESLSYGDELTGIEESVHKQNAIALYTRSLDFGLEYLKRKGIKRTDLLGKDEQALKKLFSKKLEKKDYSSLLFTAQSWGSLINLQKDNVALISHVPQVKIMFDWVCENEPAIENGVCDMYFAQYEASRPRMLGGNPEKAKELYKEAIKNRPRSLLIRVAYLQYSVIPAFDLEAYDKEAKILHEEFLKWGDMNRDTLEDKSDYKGEPELNLYNAIARKRFEFMEKNKKKIF